MRIEVKVVLLPGRVFVKIRDKDENERSVWWADVLLCEEMRSKILGVYKFWIYQECVESQRADRNVHMVES